MKEPTLTWTHETRLAWCAAQAVLVEAQETGTPVSIETLLGRMFNLGSDAGTSLKVIGNAAAAHIVEVSEGLDVVRLTQEDVELAA